MGGAVVKDNAEPRAGFPRFVYMDCITLAGHVLLCRRQARLTTFVATTP